MARYISHLDSKNDLSFFLCEQVKLIMSFGSHFNLSKFRGGNDGTIGYYEREANKWFREYGIYIVGDNIRNGKQEPGCMIYIPKTRLSKHATQQSNEEIHLRRCLRINGKWISQVDNDRIVESYDFSKLSKARLIFRFNEIKYEVGDYNSYKKALSKWVIQTVQVKQVTHHGVIDIPLKWKKQIAPVFRPRNFAYKKQAKQPMKSASLRYPNYAHDFIAEMTTSKKRNDDNVEYCGWQ